MIVRRQQCRGVFLIATVDTSKFELEKKPQFLIFLDFSKNFFEFMMEFSFACMSHSQNERNQVFVKIIASKSSTSQEFKDHKIDSVVYIS